jgi:hypothetical protein
MFAGEAYRNTRLKSRDQSNLPFILHVLQSLAEVTLITMGRTQITAHNELKG